MTIDLTKMQIPSNLSGAIQHYFDALYECDTVLLAQVFHPSACLFDADDGRIVVDQIGWYHDTIKRRTSPLSCMAPREDKVLWIDMLSGAAATVKVHVRIQDNRFMDHLMFAFDGSDWRIVSKLWHLVEVVR